MERRPKESSKPTRSASFTLDIAEVCTQEGKLYLYVAIDRTSKFAFARLAKSATMAMAVVQPPRYAAIRSIGLAAVMASSID